MGGAARESYKLMFWRRWMFRRVSWRYGWRLILLDNFAWIVCSLRGHVPYNTSTIYERDAHACKRCASWLPSLDRNLDREYCLVSRGIRCDTRVTACWCEHCSATAQIANPAPWDVGGIDRATEHIPTPQAFPNPKADIVRAIEASAVGEIARTVGGKIEEAAILPDGSGFATMSYPLPAGHWLHAPAEDGYEPPPMPFRMGAAEQLCIEISNAPGGLVRSFHTFTREQFAERIRSAGKYALRASTMNGKEADYDPDAVLQNLVVGMIGYWSANGLSGDEWANPKEFRGTNGSS